ncbi:MAG: hypothetical protein DRI80_19855, partial [Chloroflexota bacterium]
ERLAARERALRDALSRPEDDPRHRPYHLVRDELAAAVQGRRALERELLAAAGVETGIPAPEALQHVPPLQDGRTGLLSLAVTEHGTLALLLTAGGLRHSVVEEFTARQLRELVQGPDEDPGWGGWLSAYFPQFEALHRLRDAAFWAALMPQSDEHRRALERARAACQAATARWREAVAETLHALGESLWPALDETLREAGVERVILVPQGMRFLLPLHACPLNGDERACDRYTIAYAPAGTILARLAGGAGGPPRRRLLIANPTGDLRYTPSEVLAVERTLGGATTLWEQAATQAQVVETAREADLIHFSGHGTYDWRDPEQSGLLLRDPRFKHINRRTGEGIDLFAVAEMREELQLARTRLVTLSACETGLVEMRRGLAEEYIGLPSALLEAGARAVVASLWAVDDLATALLMRRFYVEWQQGACPIAEALRRAQRWLRTRTRPQVEAALDELDQLWAPFARQDDDPAMRRRAIRQYWEVREARERLAEMGDPPFAHPYWWAAFQAVGDVL